MLPNSKKSLISLGLLASSTLLFGCGGSSGGGNTVAPPPPPPANTAPVVTGDASPTIAENLTAVSTYTTTDAEGDAITLSLSGADAALFTIDADGNLSFVTAPDFDNGETGPFEVVIVATDDGTGNLSGEFTAQVSVSNEVDPAVRAVVQTVASDFVSGSEVVFMDGQTQQVTSEFYIKAGTDYTIDTYQSEIYHIGRGSANSIDKYDATSPADLIWSYTTNDSQVSTNSNAYSLTFVSANKAYLIRYDTDKVWIVNPQAQAPEAFKIGELDLVDYILDGNTNGTPRPASAVIADGKLYLAMQRMSDDWVADTAYIAVFDTTTDEEIETNANTEDAVKGIPLLGRNPMENSVVSANNKIYVTTRSPFFPVDLSMSRIEEINPTDYSVRPVLTAGDITNNTTHPIKSSVIVSETQGYFFTSAFSGSTETSTLYEFNPTTGEIVEADVGGNGTEAISFITLDKSNVLWVSIFNDAAPGVDLIDTTTNTKIGSRLITELNPNAIRFLD